MIPRQKQGAFFFAGPNPILRDPSPPGIVRSGLTEWKNYCRPGGAYVLPFPLKALISRNPWPDRLNRMTCSLPSFFAASASSTTAAIACEDSEWGHVPEVRAPILGLIQYVRLSGRAIHALKSSRHSGLMMSLTIRTLLRPSVFSSSFEISSSWKPALLASATVVP